MWFFYLFICQATPQLIAQHCAGLARSMLAAMSSCTLLPAIQLRPKSIAYTLPSLLKDMVSHNVRTCRRTRSVSSEFRFFLSVCQEASQSQQQRNE